jgi:hypothetical protein
MSRKLKFSTSFDSSENSLDLNFYTDLFESSQINKTIENYLNSLIKMDNKLNLLIELEENSSEFYDIPNKLNFVNSFLEKFEMINVTSSNYIFGDTIHMYDLWIDNKKNMFELEYTEYYTRNNKNEIHHIQKKFDSFQQLVEFTKLQSNFRSFSLSGRTSSSSD